MGYLVSGATPGNERHNTTGKRLALVAGTLGLVANIPDQLELL
jgi:hypothetical protein